MIHYFKHGPAIAAVEDDAQAAKYAAAGWKQVTRAAFVEAWKKRDMVQLDAMKPNRRLVLDWTPTGYRLRQ